MTRPDAPHIREALDLIARKTLEDEARIGAAFPYVTHPDGSWDTMSVGVSAGYTGQAWSHGNWFCGFWVGMLLTGYLHTGDEAYLELARDRMVLVEERARDGNTHDIGFIFLSSAMPFHRITGEVRHRDTALRAADKLRSRLVVTEKGAYVSSWGPMSDPRGRAASAIDTMANIPLLYWAAREADDASYRLAAEAHARMTMLSFNRADNTQFHAVEYDTETGDRLRGYTFQGAGDDSYWSRGTGWAVMGLAVTAAHSATGRIWTRPPRSRRDGSRRWAAGAFRPTISMRQARTCPRIPRRARSWRRVCWTWPPCIRIRTRRAFGGNGRNG